MTKKYDSTVARIAGNIASGIMSNVEWAQFSEEKANAVAVMTVSIARRIVKETERTEPEPK